MVLLDLTPPMLPPSPAVVGFGGLASPCLAFPSLGLTCFALLCSALLCTALHCIALFSLALPRLAYPGSALPCLALPCLASPCAASAYIVATSHSVSLAFCWRGGGVIGSRLGTAVPKTSRIVVYPSCSLVLYQSTWYVHFVHNTSYTRTRTTIDIGLVSYAASLYRNKS